MPVRHLVRKKFRSRSSSTRSSTQKTKPVKNQHSGRSRKPSRHESRTIPRSGYSGSRQESDSVADMAADSCSVFTPTAHERGLGPRWMLREFGSQLEKDSSGRIRAKARRRRRKTLYVQPLLQTCGLPSSTRNKRETRRNR